MKTIMIVEDSKTIREILKTDLSSAYKVIEAKDGKNAFKILADQPIDLFILDLYMPELDGLSLLGIIKNDPRYKNIPAIMLTVETTDFLIEKGKELGVSKWVSKPYDVEELLSTVQSLIS